MPGQYHRSTPMPKACKVKTLSSMVKALKKVDQFDLTHIEKLRKNVYYTRYPYNGLDEEFHPLYTNPENFSCLSEKVATNLSEKVSHSLDELLMMFPAYAAEQERLRVRQSEHVSIENLDSIIFPYIYKQYGGSDSEYTLNKNRSGWVAAIGGLFRNNPNRSIEWYESLYTHLRKPENSKLIFDANESISISMHISSWSFWVVLTTTFQGEELTSGNCSYRDSIHNRV